MGFLWCRFKDGKELQSSDKFVIRHDEKDYDLYVNDITMQDQGTYECKAYNSEGSCSTTADLTVVGKYLEQPTTITLSQS